MEARSPKSRIKVHNYIEFPIFVAIRLRLRKPIVLKTKVFAFILCLFTGLWSSELFAQNQLFINEYMSSNNGFLVDEDGEDVDWIELYNASEQPKSLQGHFLSDRAQNLYRWAFPDTIIGPQSYLVVYASGKNRQVAGKPLHCNFSIAASGEPLFLTTATEIVHQLSAMSLETNLSAGLGPDGSSYYVRFGAPSPGYTNDTSSSLEVLSFNRPGGYYQHGFSLAMVASRPDLQIKYSLNGSAPDFTSTSYTDPVFLNAAMLNSAAIHEIELIPEEHFVPPFVKRCIVVRAALFDSTGRQWSRVYTQSYLLGSLGNEHSLPVISICADSLALFGHDSGIFVPGAHFDPSLPDASGNYYQSGVAWERLCNFEYLEGGQSLLNHAVGLRVHGNSTRKLQQKPMRLYARSAYGTSKFNHAFFSQKSAEKFDKLVLKPIRSAWSNAGIQDHWANVAAEGLQIDYAGSQPVVVYLNGTYWGLYYLQERIDERFVEDNYPEIKAEEVELVDHWWGHSTAGESIDFLNLMDFVYGNDLANPAHYQTVANWIDIPNFIDYQLFQITIANGDWPANNMKCWREKKAGGKWRWILHDSDAALHRIKLKSVENALSTIEEGWPSNARSTLLLRSLLANPEFKQQFLRRAEELLIYRLNPNNGYSVTQSVVSAVGPEMQNNIDRYGYPLNFQTWHEAIDHSLNFWAKRPCFVANELQKHFNHKVHLPYACELPVVPVQITRLFPNPNHGAFQIDFNIENEQRCKFEIYDLGGRRLHQEYLYTVAGDNSHATQLDLKPGYYLIQLSTEGFISYQKLLVQ